MIRSCGVVEWQARTYITSGCIMNAQRFILKDCFTGYCDNECISIYNIYVIKNIYIHTQRTNIEIFYI